VVQHRTCRYIISTLKKTEKNNKMIWGIYMKVPGAKENAPAGLTDYHALMNLLSIHVVRKIVAHVISASQSSTS